MTIQADNSVSLTDLFHRDPLTYTDEDVIRIIEEMRANREKFVLGNKRAGAAPKLTSDQKKVSGLNLDIKL